MNTSLLSLSLTLVTGICWIIVYVESIRIGFRERTYAMPFWALALNFSWELIHFFTTYRQDGFSVQVILDGAWCLLDVGLLYTYFRYGRKHFPQNLKPEWFIVWSLVCLAAAFLLQFAFVGEFGSTRGRQYSAFLQNLLMSVLFISMLVRRGGSEGQSLVIAVNKWVGTLMATVSFGVLTGTGFNAPSFLILVTGLLCSIFDIIYIWMLARVIADERRPEQESVLL